MSANSARPRSIPARHADVLACAVQPTQQEVTDLRKICSPGDSSPERDVDRYPVAARRGLYAHALQAATQQAARQ